MEWQDDVRFFHETLTSLAPPYRETSASADVKRNTRMVNQSVSGNNDLLQRDTLKIRISAESELCRILQQILHFLKIVIFFYIRFKESGYYN